MTIGGVSAWMVPSSGIVTWKSLERLQQEGLERLVGAVELVDQQHRRAAVLRLHRLEQRAADQEALGEELLGQARGGRRSPRPRRCGSRPSGRGSSTRRPRWRRRGPRSTAAGSAGGRAPAPAPWRSRSCRPRPRPPGTAGGRASARGTRRWRGRGPPRSPPTRAAPGSRRWFRAASCGPPAAAYGAAGRGEINPLPRR